MLCSTRPSVTAIVVGYNHAHCLGRCFDALMGQQGLSRLQVVYVDNASTDSSVAATSWHREIQVVRNPSNQGFASAVNQGLALAEGDIVALVNPDTDMGPHTLHLLARLLLSHPEVGLVAPRLCGEDGRQQRSLAHYPTLQGLGRRLGRRTADARTGWLVGAMVLARTDLLRQMGGLEESYFVYGEDMELSYQMQRQGLQVHLERSLHIVHTGNPRWTADRLNRVYGAYMRFLARHAPAQRPLLGGALSLLWLARGARCGASLSQLVSGLRRLWSTGRDLPPEALR